MSTDLRIKVGDTRKWRITLSDADGSALNLSGATVEFNLREEEGASLNYFDSDTSTDPSDAIKISDATGGLIVITPTASDWVALSDNFSIFPGEFKITDADGTIEYTKDIVIEVQRALVT